MQKRLLKFLPFAVFITLLGYFGAYRALSYPAGADWAQYMMGAQHLWWPAPDTVYPAWRGPLYLYLLGLLAHFGTYLQAGTWLASTGWLMMGTALYGMGILSRRPMVGLGLALALLCTPLFADGMHHLGPYPLLGGVCGGLWLGAYGALVRPRNKTLWLLLYAATSGLAVAIDGRSLLIVLAAMPMILQRWPRKELLYGFGVATICWLPHLILTKYLKISLLPMASKVLEQRRFVLRHLQGDNLHPDHPEIDGLSRVCSDFPPVHATIEWLVEPCSWEMMAVNLKAWAGAGLIFPLIWGLCLICGYKRWRFCLSSILVLLLGVVLPMLLVWHPPRYAYPLLVPILSGLPLSLGFFLERFSLPKSIVSLVCLLPLAILWPATLPSEKPMTWDFPPARVPLAKAVFDSVNSSSLSYLDCARMDTGLLWAPQSRMPGNIRTFLPGQKDCSDFVVGGTGWLLMRSSDTQHPDPSEYGWTIESSFTEQNHTVQLWYRRP